MAIISITFIVLSTVVLTLNTLPYFDKRDENNNERDYPPFALLEAIYMSWFTFEFLVRILVSWCTYFQNSALDLINCRHLTSFIYKSRAPEVNLRAGSWFTRRMFLCARILNFSRQNTITENNNEKDYQCTLFFQFPTNFAYFSDSIGGLSE